MWAKGIASVVPFSCLLIIASVWDIRKRIIPDRLCLAIAVVGVLVFHPAKLLGVLLGLPFLIAALFYEGGVGGGDVKLAAASGFVLGLPSACVGTIIGLSVLLLWYIAMRVVCRVKKISAPSAIQSALPVAPFLSFGFVGAMLFTLGGNL